MEEKIYTNKKRGMLVLILTILLLLASVVGLIIGGKIMGEDGSGNPVIFLVSLFVACVGWLPLVGLRILKPQEALVLTLFGKYVGTIKGDGFYYVNPFCVGVNPAAKTQLNQSGDVSTFKLPVVTQQGQANMEMQNKKLSLGN